MPLRDIDLHVEEATGIDNNDEITHGSDLQLPWEDQRQRVTPMTLYTTIRIN